MAQSVLRLATSWTVQGSNPGEGGYFPQPSRPALNPTQPPTQGVPGLSRGVKRVGRGIEHPHRLAPRLKKQYTYTSTSPLCFMACSRVNYTFTFTYPT